MRAALILISLTVLGAGGFYGYQAWQGPADAPQYKTAKLQRGTIVSTVTATGVVEPLVKVLVGSQVSGTSCPDQAGLFNGRRHHSGSHRALDPPDGHLSPALDRPGPNRCRVPVGAGRAQEE